MSNEIDFSVELALGHENLERYKEEFFNTPEGTPDPCPCGRDRRAHIQEKIDAIEAMIQLMEAGDTTKYRELLQHNGITFMPFIYAYTVGTKEMSDDEVIAKAKDLGAKAILLLINIANRLKKEKTGRPLIIIIETDDDPDSRRN